MQVVILPDFPVKIKNFWKRFTFRSLIKITVKHW
jgi:hypothetical protein